MFERVLFPTDFSPFAQKLVGCLDELKAAGAQEIHLVHVLEPGMVHGLGSTFVSDFLALQEFTKVRMNELSRQLESVGFRVHAHIEMGVPFQEIVRVADEEQAFLIVMGTHGHGFFPGAIVGSVTHNVVRHATVPVLVHKLKLIEPLGKEECDFVCQRAFRRVLLPTDFSDCAAEALALAKQLRAAGTEEVVVLHVQDVRKLRPHLAHKIEEFNRIDSERLKRIRKDLEFFGLKAKVLLREGVPFQEIDRAAREEDVSLIVMCSHGRTALADVLLGSVADAILCRHPRPVLVVRPQKTQEAA